MRKTCMLALASLVACFLAGCAGQPKMSDKPNTGTMQEPLWVSKSASAFPDEAGKTLFGVGIAEGKVFPLVSLRRTAAIQRGRAELASEMRAMVSSVFKDYQKSCFSKELGEGEMDVVTDNTVKVVTDEVLYGSEPRDSWTDPGTGDMYVLMAVGAESIAQRMRAQIAAAEKDRLNRDADAAHKELDQIIEKYRQQPPK